MAKKRYSWAQKKAYWIGVGAAIGKCSAPEDLARISKSRLKSSYEAGFGREMGRHAPSQKLF